MTNLIGEVELDDTREKYNNYESMELGKMSERISKDHSDVVCCLFNYHYLYYFIKYICFLFFLTFNI